jgi:hypothetical protein
VSGGWQFDGVKTCVPTGLEADLLLVPASTGSGRVGVFIVDSMTAEVRRVQQMRSSIRMRCALSAGRRLGVFSQADLPAGKWRSPSSASSGWCTRPNTFTEELASMSTIRSTATFCGPSMLSSRWAERPLSYSP